MQVVKKGQNYIHIVIEWLQTVQWRLFDQFLGCVQIAAGSLISHVWMLSSTNTATTLKFMAAANVCHIMQIYITGRLFILKKDSIFYQLFFFLMFWKSQGYKIDYMKNWNTQRWKFNVF